MESPLYKAGVAQDDQLVSLGGVDLTSMAAFEQALAQQTPGVAAPLRYVRRSGEVVNGSITLVEDPRIEIVTLESTGGALSDDQRRFRESWLNSQRR
jgi:predicted metalloprotease with PDZ domain